MNMSESRLIRSFEFKSRGGILRFRVETILLIFSAFLRPPTLGQCHTGRTKMNSNNAHGFNRTASYTAQMFSSTNCTNNGFNERPRRCL